MTPILVPFMKLPHATDLPDPFYATAHSAGIDLIAAVEEPLLLRPGQRALTPTGVSFALPAGFEAQVRPRSGLALTHGVTILNTPGTIDADYRGEVKVILINLGHDPFIIERGMRIAQLVIAPVVHAQLSLQIQLPQSERDGGFGSTGLYQAKA